MAIHPSSIIDPNAILGKNVKIGPFCHVGPNVVLNDDVELVSHVSIQGHVQIGEKTKIYPFACIGHAPQDLKYEGEESQVIIGKETMIREYVTIHPGTKHGQMYTKIGDKCLLMIGVHIAHDCVVGNNVIMANNATLAGHVTVDDYAIIGGLSAVHQFVRIGAHCMIGGMSGVESDVIPYGIVKGERAHLNGLNLIGLRRRGFSNESIKQLQEAYKRIFEVDEDKKITTPLNSRAKQAWQDYAQNDEIKIMTDFILSSQRSVCLPKAS